MGEARRRGSFEDRKAEAVARQKAKGEKGKAEIKDSEIKRIIRPSEIGLAIISEILHRKRY